MLQFAFFQRRKKCTKHQAFFYLSKYFIKNVSTTVKVFLFRKHFLFQTSCLYYDLASWTIAICMYVECKCSSFWNLNIWITWLVNASHSHRQAICFEIPSTRVMIFYWSIYENEDNLATYLKFNFVPHQMTTKKFLNFFSSPIIKLKYRGEGGKVELVSWPLSKMKVQQRNRKKWDELNEMKKNWSSLKPEC